MKNTRAQIPGYGGYKFDLITQEIISKEGNIIKTRVDSARTNPRTVVTLVNDRGARATVEYTNLVKKTVESLEFTPVSTSILSEVLVAYYNRLTPEFKKKTLLEASKVVSEEASDVDVLEIGRILSKIHTSPK